MTKRGNPKQAQGPPRSELTTEAVLARLIREGLPDEAVWWTCDLKPGQSVEPGFKKKALDRLNRSFIGPRTWQGEVETERVRIRWTSK